MKKRKAFTLVEIMIAMFLMTIVILSVFMLNQNAEKNSMDAYYEMLCFSLAREPIEVFRAFGYNKVLKISKHHELAPLVYRNALDDFAEIENKNDEDDVNYPFDYPNEVTNFQRYIELNTDNDDYIKITVMVGPKGGSKAENWLRKKAVYDNKYSVQLDSIIMKTPKR